jgi:ATP-dependent Clp protease ATP-binding subunit ClpB
LQCATATSSFHPLHMLKVLLDDSEGPRRRPDRPRRRQFPRDPQATEDALNKLPKVSGRRRRAGLSRPELARAFEAAEKGRREGGRQFCHRRTAAAGPDAGEDSEAGSILRKGGVTPQNLNAAIESLRKGRTADSATAENAYDALKKYSRDLTQAARDGKLDPVIGRDEEIRRTIQVLSRRTKNNPVLIGEPGVGKTAIVEGPGAADPQWRRAGKPQGQEAAGARSRRADSRVQIPRRVRGAAESRAAGSHRAEAASSCSSTRCTR